jgi:LysM repeat protein
MRFVKHRLGLLILLDAVVIISIMAVLEEVHPLVPEKSVPAQVHATLSPTKAIPEDLETRGGDSGIADFIPATSADHIDLSRLRSKTVTVYSHEIAMGENYWTIAKKNHIDLYTLIGANPDLSFRARYKTPLNILSEKGILYTVRKGDNLDEIAEDYDVEKEKIEKLNGLSWFHGLRTGDVLFLPDTRPLVMTFNWHEFFEHQHLFGNPLGTWRRITSPFGPRRDPITGKPGFHYGVDLDAKVGDPVFAAGRVMFVGAAGGYGNFIELRHARGYVTCYAHLSKILVNYGEKVRRGSLIGKVGATGWVTGPHLHFEVRLHGKRLNPLLFI